MNKTEMARVTDMLRHRRKARSRTEDAFISKYLDSIPGMYADDFGNRILPHTGAKVMISAHTDSVSRLDGMQSVSVSHGGIVSLAKGERLSNCLGADDAAGIYIALRMIEANVPATFVFHRDEETGGNGSMWLAKSYPKWLESFDICLALDRRGTKDIIVSQSWAGCASDTFAESLAAQLGMGHKAADGIFTDSANYTDFIAECSNISVGYQNEHNVCETLDLGYLERVTQALIAVDWGAVSVERKPGEYVPMWPAPRKFDRFDGRQFLLDGDETSAGDELEAKWLAEELEYSRRVRYHM